MGFFFIFFFSFYWTYPRVGFILGGGLAAAYTIFVLVLTNIYVFLPLL